MGKEEHIHDDFSLSYATSPVDVVPGVGFVDFAKDQFKNLQEDERARVLAQNIVDDYISPAYHKTLDIINSAAPGLGEQSLKILESDLFQRAIVAWNDTATNPEIVTPFVIGSLALLTRKKVNLNVGGLGLNFSKNLTLKKLYYDIDLQAKLHLKSFKDTYNNISDQVKDKYALTYNVFKKACNLVSKKISQCQEKIKKHIKSFVDKKAHKDIDSQKENQHVNDEHKFSGTQKTILNNLKKMDLRKYIESRAEQEELTMR